MRLADLARIRQAVYRLLGAVLLGPDEERLRALADVAQELGRQRRLARFAFFPQWERFTRALVARRESGVEGLREDYVRLFLVNPDGLCPPYASHYLSGGTPAQVMAEVEGEYARAGFSVPASLGEPPDHAAVELEFMGLLCAEETEAWRRDSPRDAIRWLDDEARFLGHHLLRWFPDFAARVAELDGGGFYRVATGAAGAFLAHEQDLITALLGRYREVVSA